MSGNLTPFIDLRAQYDALKPEVHARINRVLEHGQYIMGPEVRELEERLESYTRVGHCVTVASGTEALLISLMALGVGPGDEVVTTPFTFVATAEVIVLLGAVPVFVDIEPDTCNINVKKIEAAITSRTKAIMPVSLYGQPADMDEINEIAVRHGGIPVIEDAAQSFGATYKGRKSCGLSTLGCTSFFPSKPLGCYGDGGAIFTEDPALAKAIREIRVHGQERRYVHTRIGVGGRMDTIQCAIVLAKLERFDWELAQRQEAVSRYDDLLRLCGSPLERLVLRADRTSACAQYTVKIPDREKVQASLAAQRIPTAVHYPLPLHLQPAYQGFCRHAELPIAERVAEQVVSLPLHANLNAGVQQKIVDTLSSALGK